MSEIFYKDESYKIIGICMETHRVLGRGFKEVIYKDALQIEFNNVQISFKREKQFKIEYKGLILPYKYYAGFVLFDSIILEVKSSPLIINGFVSQTINYLKASGMKLGLIVNFGEASLTHKRVVF